MIDNIQNVGPDQARRVYGGLRLPRFKQGLGKPSIYSVSDMNRIVDVFNSFLNLSIAESPPDKPGVIITDSNVVIQKPRPNKDLSAVSTHKSKLAAYWTFDGPAGNQIDSVTGLSLTRSQIGSGSYGDSIVTGLISDALHIDDTSGSFDDIVFDTGATSQLTIDTNGFSVFGWFKGTITNTGGGIPFLHFYSNIATRYVQMEWWNTFVIVSCEDDLGNTASQNFNYTAATWTFYHLFYDASLQQLGFSFNAAAPTMFGSGLVFGSRPTMSFRIEMGILAAANDMTWDETGIVTTEHITPSQATSVYNSGSGVTWPTIKSIV